MYLSSEKSTEFYGILEEEETTQHQYADQGIPENFW